MPEIQDFEKRSSELKFGERRFRRVDQIATLTSLACLISTSFAIIPTLINLRSSDSLDLRPLLLALLLVLYAFLAFLLLFFRIRRRRRYRMRISLTGQPRVGKTVFSTILYYIISSYPPEGVQFSGETDNILKMFRILKGFDLNEWPSETSVDGVSVVKGELERRTKYSGSSIYELSIADTAGENWASLDEVQSPNRPYLTLVASSDALVHVVSVPDLHESNSCLADDVSDLQMAAKLMNNSRRESRSAIPLLVVFSKFDGNAVRYPSDLDALFKVYNYITIKQKQIFKDVDIMEYVNVMNEKLSSEFKINYTLSSALHIRSRQFSSDLVDWVMSSAE